MSIAPKEPPAEIFVTSARTAVDADGGDLPVMLPGIFGLKQFGEYVNWFIREYGPVGPTEAALTLELARRAHALEIGDAVLGAARRQGAAALMKIVLPAIADNNADNAVGARNTLLVADTLLLAAVGSEASERSVRDAMGQARAFHRALNKLEQLQARRKKTKSPPRTTSPPKQFATEDAVAYS